MTAIAAVDSAPARLAGHVRLLAVLWFVVAGLWLIPAGVLFALGMFTSSFSSIAIPIDRPGAQIVRAFGPLLLFLVAGCLLLIAGLCFAVGWGLRKARPWARGLAIALGVLVLLHPPFGTALGVYTLWVLLSGNAGAEYERMAAASC
jgi:hypothetical protein